MANPFLDYLQTRPRANPFFASLYGQRMQAGGALPQDKVSEVYGFGEKPTLGVWEPPSRYIKDPIKYWLGRGLETLGKTGAPTMSRMGTPSPRSPEWEQALEEQGQQMSGEAERDIQRFEHKTDEIVATSDNPFLKALGKSAGQVLGYATQGAVVAPTAHAVTRSLPLASKAAKALAGATLGGAEEAAFEVPEGGNPFIGGAVGATMGALPFVRGSMFDPSVLKMPKLPSRPPKELAFPGKGDVEAPPAQAKLSQDEFLKGPEPPEAAPREDFLAQEQAPDQETSPLEDLLVGREAVALPIASQGETNAVRAGGQSLQTDYSVVEASSLNPSHNPVSLEPNPNYTLGEIQNRTMERGKAVHEANINNIINKMNPPELGRSALASTGAPIVNKAGENITGNTRTMALQRGYATEHPSMAVYRRWLKGEAEALGLDAATVDRLDAPVLVQVAGDNPDVDLVRFAEDANRDVVRSLSSAEQGLQDARNASVEGLGLFVANGESGIARYLTANNIPYLRQFANEAGISEAELGTYYDENGQPTEAMARRLNARNLALAYHDPEMVSTMVDKADRSIKTVGHALEKAAPRLAYLEAQMQAGHRRADLSAAESISNAIAKLRELRETSTKGKGDSRPLKRIVGDFLAQEANSLAPQLSKEEKVILDFLGHNHVNKSNLDGFLNRYAELVDQAGDPGQASLFGDAAGPELDLLSLVEQATREAHLAGEQAQLFGGPTADPDSMGAMAPVDTNADPVMRFLLKAVDAGLTKGDSLRPSIQKAQKFIGRVLTTAEDFAPLGQKRGVEYAERRRLRDTRTNKHTIRHAINVKNLTFAVKQWGTALKQSGQDRTEAELYETILQRIEMDGPNRWEGVDTTVAEHAQAMRDHIDELTGGILKDGRRISKEMRTTLEDNVGSYLRRSFAVHADPAEWRRVVQEEKPWIWNNMKDWLTEQYPEKQEGEIQQLMDNWLDKSPEVYAAMLNRGDEGVGRANRDPFKRRIRTYLVKVGEEGKEGYYERMFIDKDKADRYAESKKELALDVETTEQGLPQVFDDFLGLDRDPRSRVGASIVRMASYLESQRFLNEVTADLRGAGMLLTPNERNQLPASKEVYRQIAGGAERSPLEGFYAREEVALVLQGLLEDPVSGGQAAWLRKYMQLNAAVRIGKTAGSIQTHFRNLVSWGPMLAANGHFRAISRIPRAAQIVAAADVAQGGRGQAIVEAVNTVAKAMESVNGGTLADDVNIELPLLQKLHILAVGHGLIGEGGLAGETDYYTKLLVRDAEGQVSGVNEKGLRGYAEAGLRYMQKSYQREDDLGKMAAWLSEINDHQYAHDSTFMEAANATAPDVRDLYPTYSKTPKAVKALRDLPFVADFPTFWGEVVRTSKNIVLRGARDLKSDNWKVRQLGAKRLSGFISTALVGPAAVAMAFRALSGATKEDEENARLGGAPWNRNSDLAIVEKKGDGKMTVFDLSYMNPYSIFREPVRALMRGLSGEMSMLEATWDAAVEATDPFASESILAGTIADLTRNRVKGGTRQIRQRGTPLNRQARDVSSFVARRIGAGVYTSARRIKYALSGEVDLLVGRTYDLDDELVAVGVGAPAVLARWGVKKLQGEDVPFPVTAAVAPGARHVNVDLKKDLLYEGIDFKRRRSELSADWNRMKVRLGPKQRLQHRQENQIAWDQEQADLLNRIERYRASGDLTHSQIRKALEESGMGVKNVQRLMRGQTVSIFKD